MNNPESKSPCRLSAPSGEPVPQWDTERLERRSCIVCNNSKYASVCCRPDGLEVGQCTNCFAFYLPIVPDDEQLREFYRSYAKTKAYMQEQPPIFRHSLFSDSVRSIRKLLRNSSVGSCLREMILRSRPVVVSEICELLIRTGGIEGKRILEVGPGNTAGILSEVAFWGGEGIALEVDPVSSKAIAALGIPVFMDVSEVNENVDVVYASMVFEHLRDPATFLEKLSAVCVDGARMLIRVPNAGQVHHLGVNWVGFRVDLEHLNYFDQCSVSTLLARSGFSTECVWFTSQPILPEYLKMANRNKFLRYAETKSRRAVKCTHDLLTGSGDFMLTLLARKDYRVTKCK